MLEFFIESTIIVICFSIILSTLAGAFYLVQLVTDRFLISTLPLIAETWGKFRYPDKFQD